MITVLAALALAAQGADQKVVKYVLDGQRYYKVGVNYAYQLTVRTPSACKAPTLGDPDKFAVLVPDPSARRFIVTAAIDQVGAVTNVTFECDGGVLFTLEVTQVQMEDANLIVELELDKTESARVAAAIEQERARCTEELDARINELRSTIETELHDAFVAGVLRRLVANDDEEGGRADSVIVITTQQLLAGDRGYIVFSVSNRTSKEIVIRDVEVLSGDSMMAGTSLVMPQRRVAPASIQFAVAMFDAPDGASEFTLVVHEDGPRTVRVTDIDL